MSEQTRYVRLAQICQLINSNRDLRSVLDAVATAISAEVVRVSSVGIYLPQEDGAFRGYVGKPGHINGVKLDEMLVNPATDQLVSDLVHLRKSVYIPDTSVDGRPDPRPIEMFQIKSLFGLPITYEDELYGLVFLFNYGEVMNLTDEEMQSIEAYVNMAAVAIRNGKQFSHIQTLLAEKQLLLDVTRELSHCSTTEQILSTCFRYVGQVVNNRNIGVHLCDITSISGPRFKPAKMSKQSDWTEEDWKETHREIKLDYNRDLLFQEVIQKKKAIFIPDVFKDHRPNHDACSKFGIKSIFMIPLVAMGQVLGTIPVVSLGEQGKYTEAEMTLAQSVVDVTATALSNVIRMEYLECIVAERTSELEEKTKLFQLILNSAGEGIYGLDLSGDITFCNPSAADMLGYEVSELIGTSFTRIMTEPEVERLSIHQFLARMEQIQSQQIAEQEYYFHKKDSTLIPVEYDITPIQEEGRTTGAVVTFKDITDRKNTEDIIRKADKLSVIGELAAGVAHEIRNPLTTIRGFIQLLQSRAKHETTNFGIMLDELDRINFIISELLFVAKPEDVMFRNKELLPILNNVILLLQAQATMNNVQLVIEYVSDIPDMLCGESQLKQAFINILKNAIESMEHGGTIHIQVQMEDEKNVSIHFADQGIGISQERIKKLGEPFYTTKEKGFGLGLMITFQIVKRHNGTIRIASPKDGGTVVTVTLPINTN
ncbi:ATP-binding protein [Paenibacillus sp. N1-5-1-14]|uniref:ATP-binding protein n=1 Tax=Paenibacillus radicibacter TaxID=2972488 RepID=UPI002158E911|nr:ATP-binding protein [Paenibacillus radicibacter]MCR8644206.1 ATP-binding protein [Paenibacillus radicibacter]